MRPATVRMAAIGSSAWIPVDYLATDFSVGLAVVLSNNGDLTYTVEHTFDDIFDRDQKFSAARVTTTGTITKVNHGLRVGDWTKFSGLHLNQAAPFDAEYNVATVTSANVFTVTVANAGITAIGYGQGYIQTARVFPNLILAASTASGDSNYSAPIRAIRLTLSAYVAGFADLTVIQSIH